MINLQNLRYARFNSSIARAALGTYFRSGQSYRIPFGPLHGLRMYYDQTVNFHAVLGLWDNEILGFLDRTLVKSGLLPTDGAAADVGANIGYYSMWLSRVAFGGGRVHAFEPSGEALPLLSRNLSLNNIENVEIVEMACGDHIGTTDFFIAKHHHSSSIHADWAGEGHGTARRISVSMTTLDAYFSQETGRLAPSFIKFDIEGGGTHALPGARKIIGTTRPYILIESHTTEEDRAISHVLTEFDYRGYRLNDKKWVRYANAVHPDKEGVWGTLLLTPQEHYASVAAIAGNM